jgi:acyl-CoA thioester hydrolase
VPEPPFHFSTELRVRLPETDAMGVVFHGNFFTYLEVGRMDYLRNLDLAEPDGGGAAGPIRGFANVVARAGCEFRSPARFDDPLVVQVRIAEIGRTSFRFAFRISHKRENRLVAEGESVHVAIDPATWQPVPVPEPFRAAIRAFEGAALVERA